MGEIEGAENGVAIVAGNQVKYNNAVAGIQAYNKKVDKDSEINVLANKGKICDEAKTRQKSQRTP